MRRYVGDINSWHQLLDDDPVYCVRPNEKADNLKREDLNTPRHILVRHAVESAFNMALECLSKNFYHRERLSARVALTSSSKACTFRAKKWHESLADSARAATSSSEQKMSKRLQMLS